MRRSGPGPRIPGGSAFPDEEEPPTTLAVSTEDLAQGLGALGLPPEEARAYLLLLRRGPSHARDLVAPLALPRTKAYRVLQGLMRRGFASATLRRPSMYVAVPPNRAFELLRAEAESHLEALRAESQRLGPMLALLPKEAAGTSDDSAGLFRVVQGLRDVRRLAAAVAANARSSLDVIDAPPPTSGLLRSWWPLASAQIARPAPTVRMRVVVEAPPLPVNGSGHPAFEMRRAQGLGATRLLLVDRQEAVLDVTGVGDDAEPVALWTCRSRLVRALAALFDTTWRLADPAVQLLAPPDVASNGSGGGPPLAPFSVPAEEADAA